LILCVLFFPLLLIAGESEENIQASSATEGEAEPIGETTEVEDVRKVDVKISAVLARINPQFESVLPSESITEHFIIYFNYLEMSFDLAVSIIDSSVDGSVMFAYLLKRLRPFVSFTQEVDFESVIAPQFKDTKLTLASTDKYIARSRSMTLGINYLLTPRFIIEPSFSVKDTFKGSISERRE
jgi:hypothetical protein